MSIFFFFLRQLLHGQRHRRGRQLGDHVDAVRVIPAACDGGGEIRLVLVIGGHQLDLLAQHLAAKIFDRNLGGLDRIFAAIFGIDAGLIVQDADLDALRRRRRRREQAAHCNGGHPE